MDSISEIKNMEYEIIKRMIEILTNNEKVV
jgi:hypothetical protein